MHAKRSLEMFEGDTYNDDGCCVCVGCEEGPRTRKVGKDASKAGDVGGQRRNVTRGLRVCYSVCYCFVLLQSDGRKIEKLGEAVEDMCVKGVTQDAFAGSTVQYSTA